MRLLWRYAQAARCLQRHTQIACDPRVATAPVCTDKALLAWYRAALEVVSLGVSHIDTAASKDVPCASGHMPLIHVLCTCVHAQT